MPTEQRPRRDLAAENELLRLRLDQAHAALRALRGGAGPDSRADGAEQALRDSETAIVPYSKT
jgi:hypothetical protein